MLEYRPALECSILQTEAEIASVAGEWRALHARTGHSLSTDYDWFDIWWRTIGNTGKRSLHIVTGRLNGSLVALLPLAIVSRKGFRVLQGVGAEGFFYCDTLCEEPDHARELWQVARQKLGYDFAHLRDVCPESPWERVLSPFARVGDRDKSFYLSIEWPTSEAWKAVSPIVKRKKLKEHVRQLRKKGELRFEICRTAPVPSHVIDGLVEQKVAWCRKNGREGMFDQPNIRDYFHQLIRHAADNGSLALAWMMCGEHIIAWHLMFQHQHKLCSYIPATHEDWLGYSPGHLMNIHGVSWAIDNGFKEFDHLQGEFEYKRLFANRERECREYFFHRSLKGWLGMHLFIQRRALRRWRSGEQSFHSLLPKWIGGLPIAPNPGLPNTVS